MKEKLKELKKDLSESKGKLFVEKDGLKRKIDVQGNKVSLIFMLQELISAMIKEDAINYTDLYYQI